MSKKKEKVKKDEPIDYQLATKNLQYTVVIKDTDIARLQEENRDKKEYIIQLEQEISDLRKNAINAYELETKLKKITQKNEKLEKEAENFNNRLVELRKKFEEEKKIMENTYMSQINHLRVTMDAYVEKVKMTNQLLVDKEKLEKDLEEEQNRNKEIIFKNNEAMRTMMVKNEIKFTNLKNKMTENILNTKNKVTELNLQYMDVSSKLTLLQNHQLLIQLEYQTQQLDDLKEKNKLLEKEVFDLSREIEIHKEVELSLAEKNKNLTLKNNSNFVNKSMQKNENKTISNFNQNLNTNSEINSNNVNLNTENNYDFNEENKDNIMYRKTVSFNNMKYNNRSNFTSNYNTSLLNSNMFNTKNGSFNFTGEKSRIIKLEKKLFSLEKQLSETKRDYNDLKDKNKYNENNLQNYENKYTGLFKFLEDCLQNFFNDEKLKKNREIYINIDSFQNGDFEKMSKEEKYSTLIILMKYLIPLMNSKSIIYKHNSIDNISLKFHEISAPRKYTSISSRKNKPVKKYIMHTTNNFYNTSKKINKIMNRKNEHENLPSIRKIDLTGSQLLLSKNLNKK